MTKRIYKMIAVFLVGVLAFTFTGTGIAQAWYGYNYYNYYDYYNYRNRNWDSDSTWVAVGAIGLGWLVGSLFNKSDKPYSEKKAKAISKFNMHETQIYRLISQDDPGDLGFYEYNTQSELESLKKVFKALAGEYFVLDTFVCEGQNVLVYLKFSKIYESKKINEMSYEQFVARQLLTNLPNGIYHLEYNKKVYKAICEITGYVQGASCFIEGNNIILIK